MFEKTWGHVSTSTAKRKPMLSFSNTKKAVAFEEKSPAKTAPSHPKSAHTAVDSVKSVSPAGVSPNSTSKSLGLGGTMEDAKEAIKAARKADKGPTQTECLDMTTSRMFHGLPTLYPHLYTLAEQATAVEMCQGQSYSR